MKKISILNIAIAGILLISFIVMMVLVYTDSNSAYAPTFVLGTLVFMFLYVIYLAVIAGWKTTEMKRGEKKKRLTRVLLWFASFCLFDIVESWLFSSGLEAADFYISFGIAVGIAYFDVIFMKKRVYS